MEGDPYEAFDIGDIQMIIDDYFCCFGIIHKKRRNILIMSFIDIKRTELGIQANVIKKTLEKEYEEHEGCDLHENRAAWT